MKDLTLAEHCRAFYEERGTYQPLLGTPGGDEAYRLWAEWAFSNMSRKTPGRGDLMDTFDKHQITIAKKTLQYSDEGAAIMGGMNKEEARAILAKHGIKPQEAV